MPDPLKRYALEHQPHVNQGKIVVNELGEDA